MRLAIEPAAKAAAQREVAAYKLLEDLQGVHLPRLLAYGDTMDGSAFFVATEFVQVHARFLHP